MVVKHVTEQVPRTCVAYTLLQIVSKTCVSFAVRAHSQEIIGRCGCFTAAAKNRSCALALKGCLETSVRNYHSINGNFYLPSKIIYRIQQCSTILHVSVYTTISAINVHDLKTSEMR